jgi:tetratricopeptide (TPR) repeat protein
MKMKYSIVVMAVAALAFNVQAQTLEDGIKMYNYERYKSAKKILAPLADKNPLANYYLGLAELQMGKNDAARTIFLKNPDNYANMSGLARVSFAEGNTAQGMDMAKALAGKAKKKEWEQLKYAADAITYSQSGDAQQAIDWYKAILAIQDNLDIRISLGDAYQKISGGGGEAMNNYEKVVEKDPKNSLAYSRIGKLWYNAHTYKLALENWEKAKEADPNNPIPWGDLADAYTYVGKYDLAKKHIEKYLELSDQTDAVMEKYLDILFLSKNYKEAIDKANDLLNNGKTKTRFYGILAFSYLELKDSVSCAKALQNARLYFEKQDKAKIFPNDYRNYARILLCNNIGAEADNYFNKAVDADTAQNKADAYRENAEALRLAKEWALAAKWYNKLVAAYPDESKAIDYFYAGHTAYFAKDYNVAAKAFDQMETKFPDQPSATYWRGRTAAAVDEEGKDGIGIAFFEKWLNIPNYDRKPNDLMYAYQYLAICCYNKGDKECVKKYLELMRAIKPEDGLLKQLDEWVKPGGGKPAAKPKGK